MWNLPTSPFNLSVGPTPNPSCSFLWKQWEHLYTCPITGRDSPPSSSSCCHGRIWKEGDGLKAGSTRLVRRGVVSGVDREGRSE
ncbi:hypothetical protein C1H46_036285 [Malus baccata]|uniref:Uncharacterized protein n=1 Tax=Malus baccata TaxID=106549 RepID=A0A540KVC7_MALBA|nr:hypothetical protein C1H46_036285 [Malus baccata]